MLCCMYNVSLEKLLLHGRKLTSENGKIWKYSWEGLHMFWLKSSNERSKFWSRSRVFSLFDKLEKKYSDSSLFRRGASGSMHFFFLLCSTAVPVPVSRFVGCVPEYIQYTLQRARSTADADHCLKISAHKRERLQLGAELWIVRLRKWESERANKASEYYCIRHFRVLFREES